MGFPAHVVRVIFCPLLSCISVSAEKVGAGSGMFGTAEATPAAKDAMMSLKW